MLAELHERVPDLPILPQGRNTGFGPAGNVGLRYLLGEGLTYVGVAPHDALPASDCIGRLVARLDQRGALGLLSADVGDGATPVVDPYFGGITVPASVQEGFEPADHPHGTLMLARASCLHDIGLFDERYFAYCEEADLGLRAKESGWEVGLERGAMVRNPTMRSGSAAVDYLMHRNTLLLVREHSGRYHAFIRFVIAIIDLVRGLVWPRSRPWLFSARGRLRGMVDFLRGHYGPPPPGYFERLDAAGDPLA
jgi:GT2 family glycosyltransferase